MARQDDTTKRIAELREYLASQSDDRNRKAIEFLAGLVDMCEELHFRLSVCEREVSPPESFVRDDGPTKLR